MTNKHEATARELYKWSVEEMGFPAQSDGERKFMKWVKELSPLVIICIDYVGVLMKICKCGSM